MNTNHCLSYCCYFSSLFGVKCSVIINKDGVEAPDCSNLKFNGILLCCARFFIQHAMIASNLNISMTDKCSSTVRSKGNSLYEVYHDIGCVCCWYDIVGEEPGQRRWKALELPLTNIKLCNFSKLSMKLTGPRETRMQKLKHKNQMSIDLCNYLQSPRCKYTNQIPWCIVNAVR